MAEIINLVSSSPPVAPPTKPDTQSLAVTLPDSIQEHYDAHDYNPLEEPDFFIEQSAKRRRTSPRFGKGLRANFNEHDRNKVSSLSSDRRFSFETTTPTDLNENLNSVALIHINDYSEIPTFSSSAPDVSHQSIPQIVHILSDDDDDPTIDDPILSSSQPILKRDAPLSERTANLLANMSTTSYRPSHRPPSGPKSSIVGAKSFTKETKKGKIQSSVAGDIDDIIESSQGQQETLKSNSVSSISNSRISNESRQARPSKNRVSTAAEVEAEKKRKQNEKAQKQQKKQNAADVAEVNKSKTNKKVSTPEMIVEMSSSLKSTSVGNQVEEIMKQLDVETSYFDHAVDLSNELSRDVGSIVRWQRRVKAEYDEDQEMWQPIVSPRTSNEKHIMFILSGEEFSLIAVGLRSESVTSDDAMKQNLDIYIRRVRHQYPGYTIIFLLQGLTAWLKRNQTVKNRSFTAAVRSQVLDDDVNSVTPSEKQSRTSKKGHSKRSSSKSMVDLSYITVDIAEMLLLHLQLSHQPLQIHHTTSASTTAFQISQFTQHLSTRPYRLVAQTHNLARASFCMDTGQIRTSADPKETYLSMLQEVNRVTPSMAIGISAAGYDSVKKLVEGFQSEEGNMLLQDVKKALNTDGGWSDRRLGPMVSKRLYKVFMGRDPGSMDGIA